VRLTHNLHPATGVYGPIALAALGLAAYAASRQLRIGDDRGRADLRGLGGLLASPIFLEPSLGVVRAGRARADRAQAAAGPLPSWPSCRRSRPSGGPRPRQAPYTYIREFHHHWCRPCCA